MGNSHCEFARLRPLCVVNRLSAIEIKFKKCFAAKGDGSELNSSELRSLQVNIPFKK